MACSGVAAFDEEAALFSDLRRAGEKHRLETLLEGIQTVVVADVDLGAVAGRNQHRLLDLGHGDQTHERVLSLPRVVGHALAQLQERMVMVGPHHQDR